MNKENYKNESYCEQNQYYFDYHGIENALCGKIGYWKLVELKGESFTPKRIIIIQMK